MSKVDSGTAPKFQGGADGALSGFFIGNTNVIAHGRLALGSRYRRDPARRSAFGYWNLVAHARDYRAATTRVNDSVLASHKLWAISDGCALLACPLRASASVPKAGSFQRLLGLLLVMLALQ